MSEATYLACCWPFRKTRSILHWYQRGWAPTQVPNPVAPLQPCCGKTRQSKRLSSILIAQSRISGILLSSLFILDVQRQGTSYPSFVKEIVYSWISPQTRILNHCNCSLCLAFGRPAYMWRFLWEHKIYVLLAVFQHFLDGNQVNLIWISFIIVMSIFLELHWKGSG